jgi:hypothetical protein
MEELKREIEILDRRIILMQDEVAEINRTLANRSATSIRNIMKEREQKDDRQQKQTATK